MADKRIRTSMLRTSREHALLYRLARRGKMPLADAARYSTILSAHKTMLEAGDTEERLDRVEKAIEGLVDQRNNVVPLRRIS